MFDLTDTVRPVLKPLASDAAGLLSRLKPQDEIAVIERASGMKSKEATFLNASVYRVVETANGSRPGTRRAIICLTDGTVNVSLRCNAAEKWQKRA
jgi:hypothetical protein